MQRFNSCPVRGTTAAFVWREVTLAAFTWEKTIRWLQLFFTITERILARWLVESYGLWEYRPWAWRNISRNADCLFLAFRKKINIVVKNKSTTILSYRPKKWSHKMFKSLQWNHSPAARGSTWVLKILWRHSYGLQECRPWKIVVDLLFTLPELREGLISTTLSGPLLCSPTRHFSGEERELQSFDKQ